MKVAKAAPQNERAQQTRRVVIEGVAPIVNDGQFPIKRVVGEQVVVEADCFTDGHDALACELGYRHESATEWSRLRMRPLGNDRWRAAFSVDRIGVWHYHVGARIDRLATWRDEFARRVDADDLDVAAKTGADLIAAAAQRASNPHRARLEAWAGRLRERQPPEALRAAALDADLMALAQRFPEQGAGASACDDLRVTVDRERARFSTWYEMFPRSAALEPGTHGTFDDVRSRLPYIAEMGFDVLYLPPIHPIGRTRRKGANNAVAASDGDVGSPWAIGAAEGGHQAVHPALGTHASFRRLLDAASACGIEIALDIAFQCAPDHPYVAEHPQWFKWRADGTVQYAENPPKKYQDIFPFHFESPDGQALWRELHEVIEFWIDQGVRLFRVDNPHTKPFAFWEQVIADIKREHPDVLFLAEAFTRPKVMHRLAKLGFSQSYTYFTWRNTKAELTAYFTELSQGPGREYFRPNCWPNTPDILHEYLQRGGAPAFRVRLVLAATLAANYGIYGPAFELMEHIPREPGAEEYLNSEKYEIRHWYLERADSLAPLIARVNRIRQVNPALQGDWSLHFHPVDNDALICYSKTAAAQDNAVVVVVNLDPHFAQSGWVALDLSVLGLDADASFQVHDLLSGARYPWQGSRNFVRLDPAATPAHILEVCPHPRSELDFDNFA